MRLLCGKNKEGNERVSKGEKRRFDSMASTGAFEKVQNIVSCGTNTIKASVIFYRKAILATRGLWFECKVVVPIQ